MTLSVLIAIRLENGRVGPATNRPVAERVRLVAQHDSVDAVRSTRVRGKRTRGAAGHTRWLARVRFRAGGLTRCANRFPTVAAVRLCAVADDELIKQKFLFFF